MGEVLLFCIRTLLVRCAASGPFSSDPPQSGGEAPPAVLESLIGVLRCLVLGGIKCLDVGASVQYSSGLV